ncbi:integrase core domain-containing protein [Vibrio nigripulchritudo]
MVQIFISTTLAEWTEQHHVQLEFIQPSMPTQNSFLERLNRTYLDEILNMYVLITLEKGT